MSAECHFSCEAAAYLADELSSGEQSAFERHLVSCAACREAMESSRWLIGRLQAVPKIEPSRDLAPVILAELRTPVRELPQETAAAWWPRIGAIAASIALLAGGVGAWKANTAISPVASETALTAQTSESVARALDWFCEHQEANGSWDATRWGGNKRFEIALTALPLVALLEGTDLTPERSEAVKRAVAYLCSRQNPDGSFGESFQEAPYIQSIATLALLRAYQRQPEPELNRSLESALNVVFASQTVDGGWGYRHSSIPNVPVTLWHKDVVELASTLGWKKAESSLLRVRQWLSSQPAQVAIATNSDNRNGTDYHRAYFTVLSLRQKSTAEAHQQLVAIRRSLMEHQADSGEESGTWNPTDQWSRAGGRIYSTALAAMALR